MQFVTGAAPFASPLFECPQQAWGDPSPNEIVRYVTKILRQFHVGPKHDTLQAAKVLEVVSRKGPHPSAQALRQKLCQVFLKVPSRTVVLKASCLIHEGDDPDAGKSANQHQGPIRNMALHTLNQGTGGLRIQKHSANLGKQIRRITKGANSAEGLEFNLAGRHR